MGGRSRKEQKEKVEINRIEKLITRIGDQGPESYSQDLDRFKHEAKRWMSKSTLRAKVTKSLTKKYIPHH